MSLFLILFLVLAFSVPATTRSDLVAELFSVLILGKIDWAFCLCYSRSAREIISDIHWFL